MTDKDKMLAGELYDANYNKDLILERIKAKDLCYEYNNLKPSNMNARNELIKKIIGKTKKEFLIEQPFICDYGYNIEIGENFYANHNFSFYTAGHPLDYETRNKGLEYAKPITVGDNVWIGGNVVVLPGVTIGDNVVIGAGSIVNKDIPSNSVAVGNPCRVIKKL